MNIQKTDLNLKNIAFQGHIKATDTKGEFKHDFFYLYDKDKYDCELELVKVEKKEDGRYAVGRRLACYPMGKESKISLGMDELSKIDGGDVFAYRFILTEKSNGSVSYAFDNGDVLGLEMGFNKTTDNDKYNLVFNNRSAIGKNGAMIQIMPDGFYVDINKKVDEANTEIAKARTLKNSKLEKLALNRRDNELKKIPARNHANKLGGTFQGIVEKLPQLEKEGVTRIVGTPFTKDTVSSHKYWTENAYRISPEFGNDKDFKKLQVELFKHGINWVSDAALVNEGFGGIHMKELLRKGNDSFSKNIFRTFGKISLGIIPEESKYTRIKFVNAPFTVGADNKVSSNRNYDRTQPTYIQFYDDRLASENQKKSNSLIQTYENRNVQNTQINTDKPNIYAVTAHDDAVYPYSIEVDPKSLLRNVNKLTKKGKIDLTDKENIKKVCDFQNFNVSEKTQNAGIEVWDGNVDIAKLNFYQSKKDNERFNSLSTKTFTTENTNFINGTRAVRDYALNSGVYWTKYVNDTQMDYISNLLSSAEKTPEGYMEAIKTAVEKGDMPKIALEKINLEVLENVLNNDYHSLLLDNLDIRHPMNPETGDNTYTVNDYVLKKAMDLPLETLPVATNLLGVITSPYMEKKPNTEEELGVSRYDTYKAGNPNLPFKYEKIYSRMENMYQNQLTPIILEILEDIPEIANAGEISDYGKFVTNEIIPDLTKYLLMKAIKSDVNIPFTKDGKFDFSNINEEKITIQSLGIPYNVYSLEEEAKIVVKKIESGLRQAEKDVPELKKAIRKRFENRNLNDFKVAEMVIDRTESGLGWRIDATKDIASIDSVREKVDYIATIWDDVIDFWKNYNQSVLKYNPHAYTTAEITDMFKFIDSDGAVKEYTADSEAERRFLEETGITSVANYSFFFSLLPDLFAPARTGDGNTWRSEKSENHELSEKLYKGWKDTAGFLFQSPEDGVTNSYTFVGNHDKPRIMHILGLDQALSYSDFSNEDDRIRALKVLYPLANDEEIQEKLNNNEIDFQKINPMSIAMGERLLAGFDKIELYDKSEANKSDKNNDKLIRKEIKTTIANFVRGKSANGDFHALAFGTRPFDMAIASVLDEVVTKTGLKSEDRKEIESSVLRYMLEPALDKFASIYKLLIALPGSPTDFAGDKLGASGFETKCKNFHQQNRNVLHWEWLEDENYKFIKESYDRLSEMANIRKNPKLSALNDGATIGMSYANSCNVQSFIRYNENSVVLVFTDSSGSDSAVDEKMNRKDKKYEKDLDFSQLLSKEGAINAGEEGFVFDIRSGLRHGITDGTKFRNAREDDTAEYVIQKDEDGKYKIKKRLEGKTNFEPVTIDEKDYNTLILYKVD